MKKRTIRWDRLVPPGMNGRREAGRLAAGRRLSAVGPPSAPVAADALFAALLAELLPDRSVLQGVVHIERGGENGHVKGLLRPFLYVPGGALRDLNALPAALAVAQHLYLAAAVCP